MCAIVHEIGFTGRRYMVCSARGNEEVTEADGCTMGEEGCPQTAVLEPYDVTIGGHEAVCGWGDERG